MCGHLAASSLKRPVVDMNNNGIPDDEETDEDCDECKVPITELEEK